MQSASSWQEATEEQPHCEQLSRTVRKSAGHWTVHAVALSQLWQVPATQSAGGLQSRSYRQRVAAIPPVPSADPAAPPVAPAGATATGTRVQDMALSKGAVGRPDRLTAAARRERRADPERGPPGRLARGSPSK